MMILFDWPRLYLDAWLRWFGLGPVPSVSAPLDSSHACALARLHAEGGFSRGWDATECSALLCDGAVIGDGLFAGDDLAGFSLSRKGADEAEILSIVIARSIRGRGAGRLLLAAHAERLALAGVRRLFLEVEAGNGPAIALYAGAGFRQVGKRKSYYTLPDGSRATALIMCCDLA